MRTSRYLRVGAIALTLSLSLAACGGGETTGETGGDATTGDATTGDTTDGETTDSAAPEDLDLVTDGTLTVCTDAPYKPMEFEQDGEYTGFDIELMRLIAAEIGLDGVEVTNTGFDPITSGAVFSSNTCDVAAASITITEEREANVDFTDPYFQADQSLLVKKDSDISSLDDLAGERLAVQDGTTGEDYARENAPDDAEIVEFTDAGDLFAALESGDVAGILQDLVVNQGRAIDDDTVEVVETFPTDESYGFATPEGEDGDALLEAMNQALATLMDGGSYDQLFADWFPEAEADA